VFVCCWWRARRSENKVTICNRLPGCARNAIRANRLIDPGRHQNDAPPDCWFSARLGLAPPAPPHPGVDQSGGQPQSRPMWWSTAIGALARAVLAPNPPFVVQSRFQVVQLPCRGGDHLGTESQVIHHAKTDRNCAPLKVSFTPSFMRKSSEFCHFPGSVSHHNHILRSPSPHDATPNLEQPTQTQDKNNLVPVSPDSASIAAPEP